MNIDKLSRLFPNLIELKSIDENYFCFSVGEKIYGIPKHELTREQADLLEALTDNPPNQTAEELEWFNFLTGVQASSPKPLNTFRFIFIKFNKRLDDPVIFRTSLQQIFNKQLIFIWENFAEVCLLEEVTINEEPVIFKEIIDVLSDDLDINMKLFISDVQHHLKDAPSLFSWMKKTAPVVWKFSHNRITEQKDSIIPMVAHLFSKTDHDIYVRSILKETTEDLELLHTIKNVIECQGNVSSAAKKMYLHRNSVQYRMEKFYELTGNDLRNFNDMIRVYLALLLNEVK